MSDAKESKISKISLDKKPSEVVELDKNGEKLFFESTPGKFLELSEEIVRELSAQNKESYLFALLAYRKELKNPKPSDGLQIQTELATASDRRNFEFTPEFKAKYHPCLKRPDELGKAYRDGYTHVTISDGVIGSYNPDAKGNLYVGTVGYVDQYLMKIPNEIAEKRLKAVEERSQAFNKAVDEQTMETLAKLGGKPFGGKERDDENWKTLE